MEASVPVLENILEGPSPWSKAELLPSLPELSPFPPFSGVVFPQRYLSGLEFGPPIKPESLEALSGHMLVPGIPWLALGREFQQGASILDGKVGSKHPSLGSLY